MSNKTKQERRDIDQLLIQAVVLLQRQHLLAENLIATGSETLAEFETAVSQGQQSIDNVLAVFNYCWALVDQLERYRKIAAVVPRLNQKGTDFRAFEASLRPLTGIRNQFQHINNHLRNENSGPLLGSVCWVNKGAQFIASLPDLGPPRSVPGIYMDTRTGEFGSQLCYVYNDDFYDLGKAVQGMREFQSFIDDFVQVSVDGKPLDQRSHFIAMRLDFKLSTADSSAADSASAA